MNVDADPSEARDASEGLAAGFDPERLPNTFFDDPYPTYAALRAHNPVHRCADAINQRISRDLMNLEPRKQN